MFPPRILRIMDQQTLERVLHSDFTLGANTTLPGERWWVGIVTKGRCMVTSFNALAAPSSRGGVSSE